MIGKTNACIIIGGVTPPPPTSGDYKVTYIDIDGTVLKEQWVNSGENATPPSDPNFDSIYLVFNQWNKVSTNITSHKDIGALYSTVNNKSYLHISLTTASELAPSLYLVKSDSSTLTVDWGDETQNTFTTSGAFNTGAHTYTVAGNYVISLWISSGSGTYTFGNASPTLYIFGASELYNTILTRVYVGSNVTSIGQYAFYSAYSLEVISLTTGITGIDQYVFYNCTALKGLNFPDTLSSLTTRMCSNCVTLKYISLPTTISSVGSYTFSDCYGLESIVYSNYSYLGNYMFQYCYSLKAIYFSTIETLGSSSLRYCTSLPSITIPSGINLIGSTAFSNCTALKYVDIASTVTSINSAFSLSKLLLLKCRANTPPTLAAYTFDSNILNKLFKIYVPDASVATYKAATNWSTYANYIYPLSEIE